jgi:hypothetical protein
VLKIDFCLGLDKDDSTIQQAHLNTINELNQDLRLLKQQNDQLETEKYILNQQLENQLSVNFNQQRNTPTPGKKFITQTMIIYHNYCIDSTTSDAKLVKKHTHPAQIHEVRTYFTLLYNFNYILGTNS